MGCIYNGVCSSLVALFSWQQVTNIAAVMAHCGISPSRYGSFSKLDLFSNSLWICVIWGKYVSLIWSLGRRLGSAAQFPPHFVGSEHIACLLLRAMSAYGGLSQ